MPISFRYSPEPRFQTLGPEFADPVAPARFPAEILRFRNQRAAGNIRDRLKCLSIYDLKIIRPDGGFFRHYLFARDP